MANEFLVARGVCGALTGSIAVSGVATRDLPREDVTPAAIVEEAPAASQERAAFPGPWPTDRGR